MDNNGNGSIPTWVNIRVKLGDLKPWALNPRHITKKQAERLAASFDSFGQVETIAVSPSLDVYNGHQRLSVLHKLHGPDYEIDARQASRPLTDDERRRLVIYLHAGAVGGWDWDSLSSWLSDSLMQWGFDGDLLGDWKKDIAALGNFLESETPEPADAEPQIDRAEELNEKWQVKTGDLWRIGEHRLLCGDSTRREDVERVMGEDLFSVMFTDPPYGISYDTTATGRSKREWKEIDGDGLRGDDLQKFNTAFLCAAMRNAVNNASLYVCGAIRTAHYLILAAESLGIHYAVPIVWVKQHFALNWDRYHPQHEMIFYGGEGSKPTGKTSRWFGDKNETTVWQISRDNSDDYAHPTQKPVELPSRGIRNSSQTGETILDPFVGSGTTIVACQNLGRKCRAIEISPAYCAVALERMATAFPSIEIERIESSNASLETCNEQAAN